MPELREYAATLPNVVYVEDNLFTCSQDTQVKIDQGHRGEKLNRMVVAACTPLTHEPLFRETLIDAGLNKYLFEMANIREPGFLGAHEGAGDGHGQGQRPGAHGGGPGGLLKPLMEKPLTSTSGPW